MTKQHLYSVIGVLFVLSGGLGLVYQIVWFKYLSLFLGNTTYAQTIVLATFMGGLAIGAAFWGRRADQSTKPLLLYGWLELGIGIYCLLYPVFLDVLKNAFIHIVQSLQMPSGSPTVLALKLLVSLVSLLLPTVLMGGTLPVLVRFISERIEESGRNVAILYFLNSLGAVGGSMLAGFFLIRLLGLQTTVYTAGAANVLVGLVAFAFGRRRHDAREGSAGVSEIERRASHNRKILLAVTTATVSGLAAMIYEIAWVRLLIPVLGSSTYSFSVMLVGFISGIAVGSFIIASVMKRFKDLFALLAICQLGVALSMIVLLPLYARVPFYFWKVAHLLNRTEASYPVFLLIQLGFVLMIMALPTVFLGMTLPVASRIAVRNIWVLGRSVGNVFSLNTLGTVLGSLGAGLVLIPLVGVKHTFEVGILLNLGMGLLVLFSTPSISRVRRNVFSSVALLVMFLYLTFGGTWSRALSTSGVFRLISENIPPPDGYDDFLKTHVAERIVYYKEGTTATVAVYEGEFQRKKQHVLLINGKADASSVGDLPTQVLLGQLPLLLRPEAQSALVIGWGSGVTAGSVLTHPVYQVDGIEISPEVVEASRYFNDVNNRPLDDPRLRLHVDDALAYLKLTQNSYDVIISEPSNPWIAGIGNLFTVEFFRECEKKLKPDGIVLQWFHLYEMDDDLMKLVIRTFHSVFPHVTVWQAQSTDIMIVGSKNELNLDYDKLEKRLQSPAVREDLQRIMVTNSATLLSLQVLSWKKVKEFIDVGEVNTEDRPRLEYGAPQVFFVNRGARGLQRFDERLQLADTEIFLSKRIQSKPLTREETFSIGMLHTTSPRGNLQFGYSVLNDLVQRESDNIQALTNLANAAEVMRRVEEHLLLRKRIMQLRPRDPDAIERYAWAQYSYDRVRANAVVSLNIEEFERMFNRCIDLAADTVDRYRIRLADIYYGTSQFVKAGQNYRRALDIRERYTQDENTRQDVLLLQFARSLHYSGQTSRALGFALQATQVNPSNEEAKDFIYAIWMNGLAGPDSFKTKL
ncbi:MAG: fused MFS/spermidine synthase [Ignavibacteriales bacterium]|nr:fused MFS/spermidine synthase [Ignavibacteriales bacterium]